MKPFQCIMLIALIGCSQSTTVSHDRDENGEDQLTERDLAGETFHRIVERHGENMDPSKLPEHHRTVVLVYQAHGIIGNGGFQYLFEGDFPGDPEFLLTIQAYKTVGASRASTAVHKAFAVFPNATPPKDIERRLEMWQSKYSIMDAFENDESPDAIYLNSMDETMQLLEAYIKANRRAFEASP